MARFQSSFHTTKPLTFSSTIAPSIGLAMLVRSVIKMNAKKISLILITVIIAVTASYIGASKLTQMRQDAEDAEIRDPKFIQSKLGYQLPDYWKVVSSLVDDNRYYWAIDGGIDESWIESMNGEAIYSESTDSGTSEEPTVEGWRITKGNRISLVMKRCRLGCCSYVEVRR